MVCTLNYVVHVVIYMLYTHVTQVLLEHGADPRIHADDGAIPEHVNILLY